MLNRVSEWRQIAKKFADEMSEWKSYLPQLERETATFRKEILDLYYKDEARAINEIATIDALATIPIFISILKDLKIDNDKKFEEFFSSTIGEKLLGEAVNINDKNPNEKIVDHFKPLLRQEIAKSFENFLMWDNDAICIKDKKCGFERKDYTLLLTQLTEQVVQNKFNDYCDNFYKRLGEKFPTKRIQLEKHKDQIYQYMNMEVFLSCAIRTFIGTDNAQKLDGKLQKGLFLHHFGHGTQLRKPFLALTFAMSGLEYSQDTNELWHEARIYLQGFYNRVMLRTDLEKKADDQDQMMQSWLHVSKEQMAAYNLVLVKLIEPHLLPKEVLRPSTTLPFFSRPSTPPLTPVAEEVVRTNTPR